MVALVLAGCASPPPEEITVTLPETSEAALFAVVNIGDTDATGRIGSLDALGGREVQVVDPKSVYVWKFPSWLFAGFQGPEIVYTASRDEREGLDDVRFPAPTEMFTLTEGGLEPMDQPDLTLADELRIPCDMRSASTRPAFEEDPEPRCPSGSRSLLALVSCEELISGAVMRRTLVTETATLDVELSQRGCRVDLACAEGTACPDWMPMFAVLPPRLSAEGNDALVSFASASDRDALCRRDDDGRYTCPDGSTFTIE